MRSLLPLPTPPEPPVVSCQECGRALECPGPFVSDAPGAAQACGSPMAQAIVARAQRHIAEHACDGLSVDELAEEVGMSRSFLEKRFREHLGHSPHAEIRRVQLARICELLERTDLPLKCIAAMTGFRYMEHLCLAFKRATGLTPGAYRLQARWAPARRA